MKKGMSAWSETVLKYNLGSTLETFWHKNILATLEQTGGYKKVRY